jgi:hypothetical protein
MAIVLVHAHVGAVHHLDDFPVDAPRHDALPAPKLLPLERGLAYVGRLAVLFAELGERPCADVDGDLLRLPALVGMPKSRATSISFTSSLMVKPWASPLAALRKVSATSLAWSEWAAAPAATFRAKFLATTVSAVAPQTPTRSPFMDRESLHGPMAHILQQLSSTPTGQGFIKADREKAVDMPSASAFSRSSAVA